MVETTSEHFVNLTVSRGKKHKFLVMDIEFLSDGKLSLFVKYYIEKSIDLFGEKLSTKVSLPAKKGLQNIYEISTRIEKKDTYIFHFIVAILLWVEKRGRPNIEPVILFLCTRVTKSTKEDKATLRRVLKYIKHTIYDKSVMVADSLRQFCAWVDAAYGVHPDLKSPLAAASLLDTGWCILSPARKN